VTKKFELIVKMAFLNLQKNLNYYFNSKKPKCGPKIK
jgi:hypothetical protein